MRRFLIFPIFIIAILTRLAAGLAIWERGLVSSGLCKCHSVRPCSLELTVRAQGRV